MCVCACLRHPVSGRASGGFERKARINMHEDHLYGRHSREPFPSRSLCFSLSLSAPYSLTPPDALPLLVPVASVSRRFTARY